MIITNDNDYNNLSESIDNNNKKEWITKIIPLTIRFVAIKTMIIEIIIVNKKNI